MNDLHQEPPVPVSAFRPGSWFGIVGPAVSVFLPPSEKARVGVLWEQVDDGGDFDEVLDSLIATGLRSLPAFLLLGSGASDVRVVARGEARAVFELASGDEVTVDGTEATTWHERTLTDVARVSVILDDEAGAPGERSVETGLVRVARLDRPPVEPEPAAPPVAPESAGPESAGNVDTAGPTDVSAFPLPPTPPAPVPTPAGDPLTDPLSSLVPDADSSASTPAGEPEPTPAAEGGGAPVAEPIGTDQPVADPASFEEPVAEPAPFEEPVDEAVAPFDVPPPVVEEAGPSADAAGWVAPGAPTPPAGPGPEQAWPAPEPLPDVAPEPSLEPPLSIGSWRRDDDPETGAQPVVDAPGDAGEETEVFDADEIADAGMATPAPWPAPSAPQPPATPEPPPGGWDAPTWGPTGAGMTPEHDGQTVSGGWDAGEYARQQPGIPGQTPAPDVTAQPVASLVFAHGEVVAVDRAILVGRAPEARRFTSTDQPRLVTVPSPNHEISSTHLEVRPGSGADHGSAVVTDMGSTNGTVLVQPGLGPESLTPGMPVQLLPGAVIDLGDGMSIQVAGA